MRLSSFFATIALSFVSISGAVISSRSALDVYTPTIISPNATTVWVMGTNVTVSWDPSNAPAHISNVASVYLRHWGTLAKGFSLRDGNVTVQVPFISSSVANPNTTHSIILFGDSGNESESFKIEFDPKVYPDQAPGGKWD